MDLIITLIFIVGLVTPWILFILTRDPSFRMLVWRTVLKITRTPMPEPMHQRMVRGTKEFATHAKAVAELTTTDPHARQAVRERRYQEHRGWSTESGLWWPDVSGGSPVKLYPEYVYEDEDGELCNACSRDKHLNCCGPDYCDCDCVTDYDGRTGI